MWQHNKNACIRRDCPIYFKRHTHTHTPDAMFHIIRSILWLAEPANGLLHIRRIYTKPFLSNFPCTAGVTDADWTQWLNKQLCYLKKCSTVFQNCMSQWPGLPIIKAHFCKIIMKRKYLNFSDLSWRWQLMNPFLLQVG